MKIALFYHSLLSDWNHGNAHFLRGIVWELKKRGHEVCVFEPEEGWSLVNLMREHGAAPLDQFRRAYPGLESTPYRLDELNFENILAGVDLVLVHEWNDHELVHRIGAHHRTVRDYVLLFHDTHHRSVTEPESIGAYDLSGYDGVLAYGKAIAEVYRQRNWAPAVWIWHEAADTRVFRPLPSMKKELDLVWIGNWGDDERSQELAEFLLRPVKVLKLKAAVYGVRYPPHALEALRAAGIEYRGWLANFRVPHVFARARVTLHVPRRPYAETLPGIPTIRPFEALACSIPLVCAPWRDSENLFTPGKDFLLAQNGAEMETHLKALCGDRGKAASLARHGLATISQRHTCVHRVDELLAIYRRLATAKQHFRGVCASSADITP
jgi:spore maturation protein CgeB